MNQPTLRTLLTRAAFPRGAVERFLDSSVPTWAKFDPELGYRRNHIIPRDFASRHGKKLMILLSYGDWHLHPALHGQQRFDHSFVEWLKGTGLPVADSLEAHREDLRSFRVSPEEYTKRYYIGHYNPAGNHFFAFAIKSALVNWLDPKPVTYASRQVSVAEFAARLA